MVVLTLPFAAGLSVPMWVQFIPLGASLVVFGLPHGAVDHLVVPRLIGQPPGRRLISVTIAVYLVVAAGYLVLWAIAPAVAFALFIALTWYHWGQGDLSVMLAVEGGSYLRTRPQRGLTLLIRGGLPMLIPLLAAPDVYRDVAANAIDVFRPVDVSQIQWAFDERVRLVAGTVFAIVTLGTVLVTGRGARPDERPALLAGVVDTAMLVLFFAVVPPVLAIGIYFCCWHSTRHIARMVQLGIGSSATPDDHRIGPGLRRFARAAALPTVGALVLLVGLAVGTPRPQDGLAGLTGIYLVGLSLLTLPHSVIVTWLDWRQGIWRRPGDGVPSTPVEP